MPVKRNNRERILWLFVAVLILGAAYVVLLSTGIVSVGEGSVFFIGEVEADAVVVRREAPAGNNAVVYSMVTLTDPDAVDKVLRIRNSVYVQSSGISKEKERYAVYFYKEDELMEHWLIDRNGLTTFSNRYGTFKIANENFDMEYITGLVE